MADLANYFDPNDVPEDEGGDFPLLPVGDYMMHITEANLIEKDAEKTGLNLTVEIMNGPAEGRKIWDYLNIRHPNAQAQGISQRRLLEIMNVTVGEPTRNTDDLLFKPFMAQVIQERRKDTGDMVNKIKRYKPMTGAGQPRQAAAPARVAPAAVAAASGTGKAPWPRRTA